MNLVQIFLLSSVIGFEAVPRPPAADTVRLVAVLPFRLPIVASGSTVAPAILFQQEIRRGHTYQKVLHEKLRTRRRNRSFRLQAPAETNRILALFGITPENVDRYSAGDLGELLGVDAVLSTRLQAVAGRSALLASGREGRNRSRNGASPEKYRCRIRLIDCRSNESVSSYHDTFHLNGLTEPNWPLHRLMQRTVRRLAMR